MGAGPGNRPAGGLSTATRTQRRSIAAAPARVAFAMSGDPFDRAAFSGLPASLCGALGELGVEIAPVDVELPRPAQRLLVNAMTFGFLDARAIVRGLRAGRSPRMLFREHKPKLHASRELAAVRSLVAARRMRALDGPAQAAISFGSEFRLPPGTAYVTLDDATIVQLRRAFPYEWMQAAGDRVLLRMIARQRHVYRRARGCCFVTHWAARSAIEDYGVPASRVHVVGCGPNRALRPVGRDWSIPRFLFVGKDFGRKNGPLVLNAFAAVRQRHPRATLDLVGRHPRVEQDGVSGHGFLSLDRPEQAARVDALFDRATCFVMPSRAEPAGYVFAEALAAGIGSIGTRNGGSETIIGDAGTTVDPADGSALTEQMLRFCDPGQAAAFGAAARMRAPRFTWRATAERVIRALGLPGFSPDDLSEAL
jgi:glycosyltransferase involved in cell wall biosynthesis